MTWITSRHTSKWNVFSNEKVGINPVVDAIAKDSFDQTVEDSFDITDRNQDKWSTHSL